MAGMITIFKGRRGAGKTLGMTFYAKAFHLKGWIIYSNYTLKFAEKKPNDFFINLGRDSNLKDCVFLLDELQVLFDSRNFKNSTSITFSHFLQQLRKRNIVILGTTQYLDTLEKRIRQHIDVIISPKLDKQTQICTMRVFDVTSLEDSKIPDYYDILFYAPDIYLFYDTNEII